MQAAGIGGSLLGIQSVHAQAPLLERLFAPAPSDARSEITNDDDESPTQTPHSPVAPPPARPQERHPVARSLPNGWPHLLDVQLSLEYKRHCNTLKTVPYAIRHDYTRILSSVVHNLDFTYRTTDERDHPHRVRAWKLFSLLSRMLLYPLQRGGRAGNKELKTRVRLFDEGQWGELLTASHNSTPTRRRPPAQSQEQEHQKVIADARRLIANGELSHAARLLRSKGVAPGTLETLNKLTDPRLRPPEQLRPIPDEVLSYRPEAPVELDRDLFARNLRTTRRGLSPGLGGTRNEHLKLALEDTTCLDDLTNVAQHVAEGDLPPQIAEAMRMCKLTAITKNATKIRGLNAGDSFRRLVARTLAQQHTDEFQRATKPYNFGMSVSSGTDAVIHFVRSLTDSDPDLVLTKIDGVGAFDHIYRSVMLSKLRTLPSARKLLPFVLMSYGATSTYVWTDENGIAHDIHQGEGGEQGDALMPALFCLGLHDALATADAQLQPGEHLVAYLDDIYVLTSRQRARAAYDIVTNNIRHHTGIEPNLGKTECWCSGGGPAPPGIAELGVLGEPPVWKGDLQNDLRGVEVLGSPLGTSEYAQKYTNDRMEHELKLLDKIDTIGHLQEEWLLLYFCGSPRANHTLRTTPPALATTYAIAHDDAVLTTFGKILGISTSELDGETRQQLQLPMRFGGSGLRNSSRVAPCAYYASWADVLPALTARFPGYDEWFIRQMDNIQTSTEATATHALGALHLASQTLRAEHVRTPDWRALCNGAQPPPPIEEDSPDPGEWRHGWQFYTSNCRERCAHTTCLTNATPPAQARLRSCSGKQSSKWLTTIPTEQALRLDDTHFRCAHNRRLGLKITALEGRCEACDRELDAHGHHYTCCMRTGRVQLRHSPLVSAWLRVLREAGVSVPRRNIERLMHTTHINRGPDDNRRMDIVTSGIPGVFRGKPLFMDATCVSPLHGDGTAMRNAARRDGGALEAADKRNREIDYPDVERSNDAKLLCLGVEVFGRWNHHCLQLVSQLAAFKAADSPQKLQKSVQHALLTRWWGILGISLQRIVAASLLRPSGNDLLEAGGACGPDMTDLLDLHRD